MDSSRWTSAAGPTSTPSAPRVATSPIGRSPTCSTSMLSWACRTTARATCQCCPMSTRRWSVSTGTSMAKRRCLRTQWCAPSRVRATRWRQGTWPCRAEEPSVRRALGEAHPAGAVRRLQLHPLVAYLRVWPEGAADRFDQGVIGRALQAHHESGPGGPAGVVDTVQFRQLVEHPAALLLLAQGDRAQQVVRHRGRDSFGL